MIRRGKGGRRRGLVHSNISSPRDRNPGWWANPSGDGITQRQTTGKCPNGRGNSGAFIKQVSTKKVEGVKGEGCDGQGQIGSEKCLERTGEQGRREGAEMLDGWG